ncbi:MAG: hypothetical protein AAB425_15000, partial [Bdellovibrionota bacterium]
MLNRGVLALSVLLVPSGAYAFNTDQHRAATGLAADSLTGQSGASFGDVARFRNTIVNWTGGIGLPVPAGNSTPAEQLAHVLSQTPSICSVPWDGGPFDTIMDRIFTRYRSGNFNGEGVGSEGAYVLIGSALHLIEDQASMPHGANIHHGSCPTIDDVWPTKDKFETPFSKVAVSLTANQSRNVDPDDAYLSSLGTTRNLVDDYQNPNGGRYWFKNEELTWDVSLVPRKSATPYNGEPTPGDEFFGEYGGAGYKDIYSDSEQTTLYLQQGKQATDYAFFFISNISKLLPPILFSMEIASAGAGAPAIINNQAGSAVHFTVAENRTDSAD